tara:strand:- start:14264 stop:17122 length:2859 start_codon:yes stop_codon:yes gene_type:complete
MFILKEKKFIPLLNLEAQVFNENEFNCQHIHLASESTENVFMVAFRTVPQDSKGIAHILEHTALCGSKKFPVRDPFFMMIRRSLNTFMNAFTSSDWTAYPFATMNKKDFDNLLDVYLDSAFFPNLDSLDFAQEGHRLEINDEDNLEIKGVVYNEMKGAMSSIPSQLWHGLSKYLYPDSTYQYNSGGNPENILELSHEELVNFHKKHYHPSNATFFTFGDMDPSEIQKVVAENVLKNFEPSLEKIEVKNETRIQSPIQRSETYNPLPGDDENHHVVLSWLLNESHDPVELLETYLLSNILLDNSASPLRKALESSELGIAPSPLTGLETSHKEIVFAAGLEGVSAGNQTQVENLILNTLNDLMKNGVSKDVIDSSVHQLEIKQREVSGSGMPYGLELMLGCLPACIHRDNPLEILDLDKSFTQLKENLKTDKYLESLIEKHLINNPHRVNYELKPEIGLNEKKEEAIKDFLAEKTKNLSTIEKDEINTLAKDLKNRQDAKDDPGVLPQVTVADIPLTRKFPTAIQNDATEKNKDFYYKTGTNGIVYHSLIYPCEDLNLDQLSATHTYSDLLTDLGLGNKSFEEIQKRQASITGGIGASFILLPGNEAETKKMGLKITSSSLEKNAEAMQELMMETVSNANFANPKRVKEIIEFSSADAEKSLTQGGHSLAMSSAAAQISKRAATNELTSGLTYVNSLKSLKDSVSDDANLNRYIDSLINIQNKISSTPMYSFTASSLEQKELNLGIPSFMSEMQFNNQVLAPTQQKELGWITGSQVCFCAEAFPTVNGSHPDAPILSVLATVLRNGYLHSAIREKGGAYGAGASHDSKAQVFLFYSYRDPKCKETFAEFSNSRQWALDNISAAQLEEGILGVISSIDKPMSPAGEAGNDFMNLIQGKSQDDRLKFRARVKDCKLSDLNEMAAKYFNSESKKAVLAGESFQEALEDQGFEIKVI